MPLAGTLHDLSISSLIQIFCLERKTTRLLVRRPHEAGFIYFVQGEVWHASAGQLNGVDAVTYILSWQFGEFHTLGNEEAVPERTIRQRWDALLMEGMKWLDERKAAPPTAKPVPLLSAKQRKFEEALAEKMLSSLSELEQIFCRLFDENSRRHPKVALEVLLQIANQTVALFFEALHKTPLNASIRRAAQRTLVTHFAWLPVSKDGKSLDAAQLLQDFQAAGPHQSSAFTRIHTQLAKIVEYACFAMIATCFRAGDIKAELAETYSIFLADLQQALQQIEA